MNVIARAYDSSVGRTAQIVIFGRSVYCAHRDSDKSVIPSRRVANIVADLVRRMVFKA